MEEIDVGVFTELELAYLAEQRLAGIATVGADGTPQVVPVSFRHVPHAGTIDVGWHGIARSKKYRDVACGSRVTLASVIHRGR
jgi:pyridoxamine 5'-phosphate oxidase family protein